jgi:hypothetical protein
MRRRPKPAKTAEQIEQDRAAAREALRRHRARRKAEKDALPHWQTRAVDDVNTTLCAMLYGGSGENQTRDRTHALAAALFDALGPEGAVLLAAQLAEEIDAGGTRAQRRRELEARDGSSALSAQTRHHEKGVGLRSELEANFQIGNKAERTESSKAPLTLDRSRPYAEVYGDTQGRVYEQEGVYFRGDGTEAGRG